MNIVGIIFLVACGAMLFSLPRRLAPFPLLLSAMYMGINEQLEIGPAHFTVNRLLVMIGTVRVLSKGERIFGGLNTLDRLMIAWAAWAVVSSLFHVAGALIFRLSHDFRGYRF